GEDSPGANRLPPGSRRRGGVSLLPRFGLHHGTNSQCRRRLARRLIEGGLMKAFTAPFLLGIDVGTTGCKTELLDIQGNTVARSYREYPLIYPRISWVEH